MTRWREPQTQDAQIQALEQQVESILFDPCHDPPAAPSGVDQEFIEASTKNVFSSKVTWEAVTEDTNGGATALGGYIATLIATDSECVVLVPGVRREVTVGPDTLEAIFPALEKPNVYYWTPEVRAFDTDGRIGPVGDTSCDIPPYVKPKAPQGPLLDWELHAQEVINIYDAICSVLAVTQDVDDNPVVIDHYIFQLQATDGTCTPLTTVAIREAVVAGPKATFEQVPDPDVNFYRMRAAAVDVAGVQSEFSGVNISNPDGWTQCELPGITPPAGAIKPKQPTGIAIDFKRTHKSRHVRNVMIVTGDGITQDTNGKPLKGGLKKYIIKVRHRKVGITIWEPELFIFKLADEGLGQWKVKAPFPVWKNQEYSVGVIAVDKFDKRSDQGPTPDGWTVPGSPSDTTAPPQPLSVTLEVKQHGFVIDYTQPTDGTGTAEEPAEVHEDILYQMVRVKDAAGVVVRLDTHHNGLHKFFGHKKPSGSYTAEVKNLDASGNRSAWKASVSASATDPTVPAVTNVGFVEAKKKGNKIAVNITIGAVIDTSDDILQYGVQISVTETTAQPTSTDDKRYKVYTPDDLTERWGNLKPKDYLWIRTQSFNRQGRKSAFSGWVGPFLITLPIGPPGPASITANLFRRRLEAKWTPPLLNGIVDPRVAHYHAKVTNLSTGVVKEDQTHKIGNKLRYAIPKSEKDHSHEIRVWTVDEEGIESTNSVVAIGSGSIQDVQDVDLDALLSYTGSLILTGGGAKFATGTFGSRIEMTVGDAMKFISASELATSLVPHDKGIKWRMSGTTGPDSILGRDGGLILGNAYPSNSGPALDAGMAEIFVRINANPPPTYELLAKGSGGQTFSILKFG